VRRRADEISAWLARELAERLDLDPGAVDLRRPFASYGLPSREAVVLSGDLQEWLGQKLAPTIFWEFSTIEALAHHLGAASAPAAPPSQDGVIATTSDGDAIAVVGLGCRFPGAPGPAAFWRLLREGVDAITEVPGDRWDADAFYDADPAAPGRMSTRWGGFVPEVDRFDPAFFGISPREASRMDPQQRLLLEVAWEALEHAGISPDALRGSETGVFVGISTSDYSALQLRDPALVDAYAGTGNAHSVAANRLSYFLDLRGPSLAVDTACSSSLVAVHLACQSIRAGESRAALAAGVNLVLAPHLTIAFSKAGMMAADGRCKTFDAAADGYVRGEGCGVVVLKRLADARADGDTVLAVVRGSAVNQDGLSNGLTAPNGLAQQAVIRAALAAARVHPHDVSYVEAHGTGTPLGDPIEVDALRAVLMEGRPPDRSCFIGSVKTNVGHLEAGAGIAGFMKTVLALAHREIPPHLHLHRLNPRIRLDGTTFAVPSTALPWPSSAAPRRAGVSAFGFGGTNAHAVLEEAPRPAERDTAPAGPDLVVLSARSDRALRTLARRCADVLAELAPETLPDACTTTRRGRAHLPHRLALVGESPKQLASRLASFGEGATPPLSSAGEVQPGRPPRIAFLFSGQGSQYAGMARTLYEAQPTFRRALDRCAEILRTEIDVPLLDVLWPGDPRPALLDETAYTQPALVAVEWALAELWRALGVMPAAVLGHSVGEYTAACVAGVLRIDDALRLVAARGRLIQGLPRDGEMAAAFAAEAAVRAAGVGGDVSIAALNGPAETVLSGHREAIARVVSALAARGIRTRRLTTSHAFHSALLDPALGPLARLGDAVEHRAPELPLVSNLTGEVAGAPLVGGGAYWARHAREPVRFAEGIQTLRGLGCDTFLEIGPAATLVGMGARCADGRWIASLRKGQDDRAQLLAAVGALHVAGAGIDWPALDRGRRYRKVSLPTAVFERQRCWLDVLPASPAPWQGSARSAEAVIRSPLYAVTWRAAPRGVRGGRDDAGDRWVILSDRGDVGAALSRALAARGADAAVLAGGMPPDELAAAARGARGVLALGALDLDDPSATCARGLAVTQALVPLSIPIWFVTRSGQPAVGGSVAPAHGALWGFARALALEHPEAWGGIVDLGDETEEAAARALAEEVLHPDGEDQVAYRGGARFVPRLEPLPDLPSRPFAARADATYLVTGGLGAVGLALSRWLVARGARTLVLTGRTADSPTPAQRDAIRVLEAEGAQVRCVRADASDRSAMAMLLADLRGEAKPLRGVLHAAGVVQPRALQATDAAALAATLAPKVAGAAALDELTRGVELDLFVLFSSMSSVLGSRELAAYAAANAFLDTLAHDRVARGLPALAVNFGPWAGGGMTSDRDRARLARLGVEPLAPEVALAGLERLLGGGAPPQAMVASIEWGAFLAAAEARRRRPLLDALRPSRGEPAGAVEATPLRRRLDEAAPPAREVIIAGWLRDEVARILDLPPGAALDERQGFFEMGMDSLMAVELKRRVEAALGLELPRTVALEFPNVAALARHLASTWACSPGAPAHEAAPAMASIARALSDTDAEQLLAKTLDDLRY
jgi:acyl transferase domain-containing protein/acyl carrier protein